MTVTSTQWVSVLLIEDNTAEAQLVLDGLEFARRPGFAVRHVTRLSEAIEALRSEPVDVVVLDLGLPDAQGLEGVAAIRAAAPGAALVIRTGLGDERLALEALEVGAQDYIVKGPPARLEDALERSMLYALARLQAKDAPRLAAIVDHSQDAIFAVTPEGLVSEWNSGAERIYGHAAAEVLGQPVSVLVPPERQEQQREILSQVMEGVAVEAYESEAMREDGQAIDVSLTVSPIVEIDGRILGASVIARDITEQKRTEARLREAEERIGRGV